MRTGSNSLEAWIFFKSFFLQLLKLLLTCKDHGFTRFRIVILRLNYWPFLVTNLVLCLASWDQQYVLSKHHRIVSADLWYACIELHRLSLHEYFHRNKWIVYHARSFSSSIRAPQLSQELQNLPGVLKLLGRKWTLGRVLIYLPREKSCRPLWPVNSRKNNNPYFLIVTYDLHRIFFLFCSFSNLLYLEEDIPHLISSPLSNLHPTWSIMAARRLPETFRKLIISKLSTNYREAAELVTVPMLKPGPDELLVKNR